jgi:hypothetical protein
LKVRLRSFDDALLAAKDDTTNYGFGWTILQGLDVDRVVRGGSPGDTWFPKNMAISFVNTKAPHLGAFDGGTPAAPTYPAAITLEKTQLAFGLYPRVDKYFVAGLPAGTDLENQQRVILAGIVSYAKEKSLFPNAYTAISDFLLVLLQGDFTRDPRFDDEAVRGLSALLQSKVSESDHRNAVVFAERLLNDIELGLSALDKQRNRFGGGNFTAARGLPPMVEKIFNTVTNLVRKNPDLERDLLSSKSLARFQSRVADLLARLRDVPDDPTRRRAIAALATVVKTAEVAAVTDSKTVARLAEFGRTDTSMRRAQNRLGVARTFKVLSDRPSEIGSEALTELSKSMTVLDEDGDEQDRPLWDTILSKAQVDRLVAAIESDPSPSSGRIDFLRSVIASDGPQGNSPASARNAIRAYVKYLAATPAVAKDEAAALREAASQSQYPSVTKDAERQLAAQGL